MPLVTTEYFDEQAVNDVIAHSTTTFDGILHTVDMGLIVNTPVPAKDSILADIEEPDYAGYARAAQTFGVPARNAENNIQTEAGLTVFQMSDAVIPTTVNGYFVVTHTGSHLLWMELFSTPVALIDALSYLGIVAIWVASNEDPGSAAIVS